MNDNAELMEDESRITEITIQPDGRVYVFGTSRQVLEVLEVLHPGDEKLLRLLGHVRKCAKVNLFEEIGQENVDARSN